MGLWLLFGFLVAGLLSVFVSPVWLQRYLGGSGFGPIARASLFGVPLPLCSCGVIPVAASLKQHGASRPATTAFLLSTPQTGVDSILVTWTLLGPLMAVFRPIAALATGLLGGAAVQALDPPRADEKPDFPQASVSNGGAPEPKGPFPRAFAQRPGLRLPDPARGHRPRAADRSADRRRAGRRRARGFPGPLPRRRTALDRF